MGLDSAREKAVEMEGPTRNATRGSERGAEGWRRRTAVRHGTVEMTSDCHGERARGRGGQGR
jgi:hypothetical protein